VGGGRLPHGRGCVAAPPEPPTTLVIGDLREMIMRQMIEEPIGFVAMDLDFYSSTVAALRIFERNIV
jgi:hypothetical protein